MRKLLLCLILGLVVMVPSSVVAAETYQCSSTDTSFCALAPIPGLNLDSSGNPSQPNAGGVATFLNNIYFFAIGIAVILAIGMIIYGGVEYALSEAITSKAAGKKRITQSLFGLVLVLAPALVFSIINPEILKLNVNFEPLKTTWGDYAQASYTVPNKDLKTCTVASGFQKGYWGYVAPDPVLGGERCVAWSTQSECDANREREDDPSKYTCTEITS